MNRALVLGKEGVSFFRSRPAYLNILLVFCLVIVMLVGLLFGEKIQVSDGFGYDGVNYARIARSFEGMVANGKIDSYRIQRVFPSAVIHFVIKLASLPFTPKNIVLAFGLLNTLILAVSALVWCLISDHLGMSAKGKIFGFVGLFANFAILKLPSYYPVLTDIPAFGLGILALYFYLRDFELGLYALILLGAFTWPTVAYECVLLASFPHNVTTSDIYRDDLVATVTKTEKRFGSPGKNFFLALLVTGLVGALVSQILLRETSRSNLVLLAVSGVISLIYILFAYVTLWDEPKTFRLSLWLRNRNNVAKTDIYHDDMVDNVTGTEMRFGWPIKNFFLALLITGFVGVLIVHFFRKAFFPIVVLIPMSTAIALIYILFAYMILWDEPKLFRLSFWLHSLRLRALIVAVSLLVACQLVQRLLSGGGSSISTLDVFENTVLGAIKAPGIFLVAHIIYFGPIIVVVMLYWKAIAKTIRELGGGLLLVVSLGLFFTLMSESRIVINFFPIFVVASALALDRLGILSTKRLILFTLLSLLLSRFWLPIGGEPGIRYFMNFGPWMTNAAYFIFLVVSLIATVIVYKLLQPRIGSRKLRSEAAS